jgi:hypothetical protein
MKSTTSSNPARWSASASEPNRFGTEAVMIFAFFDGYVTRITKNAIGFSVKNSHKKPDIWISRKHLRHITYNVGGDKRNAVKNKQIEAVEIPRWLAKDLGLKIDNE